MGFFPSLWDTAARLKGEDPGIFSSSGICSIFGNNGNLGFFFSCQHPQVLFFGPELTWCRWMRLRPRMAGWSGGCKHHPQPKAHRAEGPGSAVTGWRSLLGKGLRVLKRKQSKHPEPAGAGDSAGRPPSPGGTARRWKLESSRGHGHEDLQPGLVPRRPQPTLANSCGFLSVLSAQGERAEEKSTRGLWGRSCHRSGEPRPFGWPWGHLGCLGRWFL